MPLELYVHVDVLLLLFAPCGQISYFHCFAGVPTAAPDRRTAALIATDIVGFTALAADIGAEEIVEMLDT